MSAVDRLVGRVSAAVLANPDLYPIVAEELPIDILPRDRDRRIREAMDSLVASGKKADAGNVLAELERTRHLEDVGEAYLFSMETGLPALPYTRDPEVLRQQCRDIREYVAGQTIDDASVEPQKAEIEHLLATHGLNAVAKPVDPVALESRLRNLGQALVGASLLRRETIRAMLVERLGAAGVKAAARLVDAALHVLADESRPLGQALLLRDDEPWPEPVDGVALLNKIVDILERYLVLPKEAAVACALWIMHAYLMDVWKLSPLLVLMSPTKRCGKSTALVLIGSLCPRRLPTSSVTAAGLFRAVDKHRPTLQIDEADVLLHNNDEVRSIINSGYLRDTAWVPRVVGEQHDLKMFSTWAAKLIALIGVPPDTILDRAIAIEMQRKRPCDRVQRLRHDRLESDAAPLRRQLARLAIDIAQTLDLDPAVPHDLHDRAADNWRPLLSIADGVGGAWPERGRRAARLLSARTDRDDAPGPLLLNDIRGYFAAQGADMDAVFSDVLVAHLASLEDRPWGEWRDGMPLSKTALARLLKEFGIIPAGTIRIGKATGKGYRRSAFVDAWGRYLLADEPSQRNNANESGPESSAINRHTPTSCDGSESGLSPINTEPCYGVTDASRPDDDEEVRIDCG